MLDAFQRLTASGYAAVLEEAVEAERADRVTFAEADAEERFWRLNEKAPGDAWVGGYFDALPAVKDDGPAVAALEANPDLQLALGLVGGFIVDPPYG